MQCHSVSAPTVASATVLSQVLCHCLYDTFRPQFITALVTGQAPVSTALSLALLAPQCGQRGTALITQRNCLSLEGVQRKAHVIAGYPDVQGLWEGGWAVEPVQKMYFTGSWRVQLPDGYPVPKAGCAYSVLTGLRGQTLLPGGR